VTHVDVLAAIEARGGRLVASIVLDEDGRTMGSGRDGRIPGQRREYNATRHCTGCGDVGHDRKRCNGKGNPPKPTHRERRKQDAADVRDWLREAAKAKTPLDEAKRIIAERIAARRGR
jgi:hypothetical protein